MNAECTRGTLNPFWHLMHRARYLFSAMVTCKKWNKNYERKWSIKYFQLSYVAIYLQQIYLQPINLTRWLADKRISWRLWLRDLFSQCTGTLVTLNNVNQVLDTYEYILFCHVRLRSARQHCLTILNASGCGRAKYWTKLMAGNSESRSQFSGLALPYSSVCFDNNTQALKSGGSQRVEATNCICTSTGVYYNSMRHDVHHIPSIDCNYVSSHILHHSN